jgi:hypothetical protein
VNPYQISRNLLVREPYELYIYLLAATGELVAIVKYEPSLRPHYYSSSSYYEEESTISIGTPRPKLFEKGFERFYYCFY